MHELGNNDSKPSHVDEIHQIELLFMIHVLTTKYLKNEEHYLQLARLLHLHYSWTTVRTKLSARMYPHIPFDTDHIGINKRLMNTS